MTLSDNSKEQVNELPGHMDVEVQTITDKEWGS
jgi:hypothetical protein